MFLPPAKKQVILLPRGQTNLVSDGDSITFYTSPTSYARKYAALSPGRVYFSNLAANQQGIIDVQSRASTVDGLVNSNPWCTAEILTVYCGINDLRNVNGAMSSSEFLSRLTSYCAARKAAFPARKIAVGTIGPCDPAISVVTFNAERAAVNTGIRAMLTNGEIDAVMDFAADADMGPDAAYANTTYFGDGLHPTEAGHQRYLRIMQRAISKFTLPLVHAPFTTWSATEKTASITLSNASRTATKVSGDGAYRSIITIARRDGGKYFAELLLGAFPHAPGAADGLFNVESYLGTTPRSMGIYINGDTVLNGGYMTIVNTPVCLYAPGDYIGFAFDFDAGKLWVRKNGAYNASGNPETGANPNFTFVPNTAYAIGDAMNDAGGAVTLPASTADLFAPFPAGYSAF